MVQAVKRVRQSDYLDLFKLTDSRRNSHRLESKKTKARHGRQTVAAIFLFKKLSLIVLNAPNSRWIVASDASRYATWT